MNESKKYSGLIIGIVGVLVIGAIVVGALAFTGKSNNAVATAANPMPLPSATPVVSTTPATTPSLSSAYKDGRYTASGTYTSPAGQEAINVTLTLSNGTVTSASVVAEANDSMSKRYQDKFISGFKQYVVGKSISSLSLGAVSGSSLTPIGFNNAVAAIKAQAQS